MVNTTFVKCPSCGREIDKVYEAYDSDGVRVEYRIESFLDGTFTPNEPVCPKCYAGVSRGWFLKERIAERIEETVVVAGDAFWNVVANQFPEAEHGDMDPRDVLAIHSAMKSAIETWVKDNVLKN